MTAGSLPPRTPAGSLLIFDEVITAFGRIGEYFGAQRFNVTPDLISIAKGITNGVIPMGAVLVKEDIHQAFMQGDEQMIEFFHGYTYSGHPVAAAAGLASLAAYETDGSMQASRRTEVEFETQIHRVAQARHVTDVRNFGLMGAIDLAPREGAPGARGMEIHQRCFAAGLMVRHSMDTLQFSPFLDTPAEELTQTFDTVIRMINAVE